MKKSIGPIYTIMLDNIKVESTMDYLEAKRKFLSWIEYTKQNKVAYAAVTVIKDLEVLLEYRSGGSNPTT